MPASIQHVTVLGAGDMGHGIAEVALLAAFNVTLRDIKNECMQRGAQRIADSLAIFVRKEKITKADRDAMIGRLHTSIDLAEAVADADADLVIEAVPEILKLKQETFAEDDRHAPSHCLLASNSSSMSITAMAAATRRPDKVGGLHYFNPAILMATVEVIRTEATSDETIDALFEFCLRCNKKPVRVHKDVPGFIVNRSQSPAGALPGCWLDSGAADPETIDAMARSTTGEPMGPCETMDYTGIDVACHASNYYAETVHPDHAPSKTLAALFEQGKLGKKSGQGFFDWSDGRPTIDLTKTTDAIHVEDLLYVNANQAA